MSGDERDRTSDLGIANAALSQLSYVPRSSSSSGQPSRPLHEAPEGGCSPHNEPSWSQRGSNPRPPACHAGALPTELRPHSRRSGRRRIRTFVIGFGIRHPTWLDDTPSVSCCSGPNGNRTRAPYVTGRRPSRWTMGPCRHRHRLENPSRASFLQRRGRDSNPRACYRRTLSKRVPSTTRPPLHVLLVSRRKRDSNPRWVAPRLLSK